MRSRRGMIALCSGLLLGIVGCSRGPIIDVGTAIFDIKTGMTEQEVEDILGEPMGIYWGSSDGVEWLDHRFIDSDDKNYSLVVTFSNGVVTDVLPERRFDGEWPDRSERL